jgi:hypothetical protein
MAQVTLKKQEKFKGDFFDAHGGKLYIIDLDTGEKLGLQGIPLKIPYNPESTFASIKPYGRNNPKLHYVGSEDTLTLELSWWATDEDKMDVILKCKWLESMTKSDGFKGRPHYAHLMFGGMYREAKWVIISAPYEIGLFDELKQMRPDHATQQVTMKRVTDTNRTLEEINNWRT